MGKITLFFLSAILVVSTTALAKEECQLKKNLRSSIRINGSSKTAFYPQTAPKATQNNNGVFVSR